MAENGNLINNNNNNKNNNINNIRQGHSTIIALLTQATTTTTTSNSENSTERGYSEGDATHFRLRNIQPLTEHLKCFSCGDIIQVNSILDIYDHFSEKFHINYYGNCLYCGGKVHRYYLHSTQQFSYYHNCLRWKRGEDR